ncbi:potassium channel family protein [Salinarimonas ramus]|uniref:Metal transporter n=1 Tax=Salinarimonas ramus TaxID=690164 RepID=A0A917QGW0_9HYPH|nr:potassium channel family protein [Salinarimonas ramus]GGK50101.1 metal transporter [Salinarimonas ramus]
MLPTLAIAAALVCATVLIHYEILRRASWAIPRLRLRRQIRVVAVIGAVLVAHLVEITLYALAYWAMHDHAGLGRLEGALTGGFADFLYFSLTSYTTLGVGDLYPTGPMRLLSGIEALNGLVLIGWSASYTYLAMEEFWADRTW